jgi:hypothetical protein
VTFPVIPPPLPFSQKAKYENQTSLINTSSVCISVHLWLSFFPNQNSKFKIQKCRFGNSW